MNRSPLRLGFLLNALALAVAWLAPSQLANAQCPQICDSGLGNTAFGVNALPGDSGSNNTAIGFNALLSNTTGSNNTATGGGALNANTTGDSNTANGFGALQLNTRGNDNTATGNAALLVNKTGNSNTAIGYQALVGNTTGSKNTATGQQALNSNETGHDNTAAGYFALVANNGDRNTAVGIAALERNLTGSGNIALGNGAGGNLTIGDHNIDIGNQGVAAEANTIRIGRVGTQTATFIAGISGATVASGVGVIVGSNGQLGTVVSSKRFKDAVKPMDKASEVILSLQPVTFRYKKDLDPDAIPQFGLVAEDVAKVDPDLVARDDQGKPYTVRYEAVNAMLLNEFLKEHRKVESLQKAMADQQKENAAMRAMLKEQAAQIQKVSAQLEASKPLLQTIANNQ